MPDDVDPADTAVLSAEELAAMLAAAADYYPPPLPTADEIEAMFEWYDDPDPFKGD